MEFGVFEVALCIIGVFMLGSHLTTKADDQDVIDEEWQGVVARVLSIERTEVMHQSESHAPVVSWTEDILVCNREDGETQEFLLNPEIPEEAVLLELTPGTAIIKPAGQSLPQVLTLSDLE